MCVKVIDRNELRIGKLVTFKVGYIIQHRHVDCAFRLFSKARVVTNVIVDVDEIDGFDLINGDEKSRITNLVDNQNNARKLPLLKAMPTKKTISIQTPTKFRKSNLKSSYLPIINADQLTPSKLAELKTSIQLEKPLIIAVCEVKPKNSYWRMTMIKNQ